MKIDNDSDRITITEKYEMPVFICKRIDENGTIKYAMHVNSKVVIFDDYNTAIENLAIIADFYNSIISDTLYR